MCPAPSARHVSASDDTVVIPLQPAELWWGGRVSDALAMPYGDRPFACDLAGATSPAGQVAEASNQASPLLLSSAGRAVLSERPFRFCFGDGVLEVEGDGVRIESTGDRLCTALRGVVGSAIRPSGRIPHPALFTGPQYNSWIEQPYLPTQSGVLDYVRRLLDGGMPPGVVMIDDMWSSDYGNWTFDESRFPDPGSMARTLHAWGCHLMVWIVPYISPDSPAFRELDRGGLLLRTAEGNPAIRRWWNGFSALLDLSNPDAVAWFHDRADALIALGVDGFKFDGADVGDFRADDLTGGMSPVDMCREWSRLALRYPLNELRASWDMGGAALAQRVQDKPPAWGDAGIGSLIPQMISQSLMGYSYCCPDMVGGGEITAMRGQEGLDQEFFVRYAQVAALSPMIQFSVSPARVLDDEHFRAVMAALQLRERHVDRLLALAERAACTGEPILRPMAYDEPGLELITDQFMLGEDLIIAPVIERGARSRAVTLPTGNWRDVAGHRHEGPVTLEVDAPLDTLPIFERDRREVLV